MRKSSVTNCANVDWRSLIADQEGSRLINMVEDSFLTQVVTQPTRENNILDLVPVSDRDLVRDCEVGEKLVGSDHNNVCVQHKLDNNPTLIPDYRNANFSLACELLLRGNIISIATSMSIQSRTCGRFSETSSWRCKGRQFL